MQPKKKEKKVSCDSRDFGLQCILYEALYNLKSGPFFTYPGTKYSDLYLYHVFGMMLVKWEFYRARPRSRVRLGARERVEWESDSYNALFQT